MMEQPRSLYYRFVEISAALLLLIYPTLMFSVKGGMNGAFLCMLLLAVVVWVVRPVGMNAVVWRRDWTGYMTAMLALSVAILISQIAHQNFSGHPHDAASRFWLSVPILLLLQRLNTNIFLTLQLSFPVCAITGLLLAHDNGGDRVVMATLNAILFGNFELLLGFLSLLSIDWFGRDGTLLRIFKIFGFMAGLVASIASGTRGGWLAIPIFVAIIFYSKTFNISSKIFMIILISALSGIVLLYSTNANFNYRLNAMVTDLKMLDQESNRQNVMQNRLRLYDAAISVFLHNPIAGVGPEGFALEMQPMLEAGKITAYDAEMGRGEVHNDILSKAAGMGIFGLIAILAIYVVPFRMFWKATRSALPHVKRAGFLGVTFVSGFFVFGLTVEILNLTMSTAFYSFTVAVLLAVCYNVHNDEPSTSLNLKANKIDV